MFWYNSYDGTASYCTFGGVTWGHAPILQMYRNIFTCIWVICDLEKGKNKHFNIIKSSFNLLDLPFVAMLMCVNYKSFLYVQIFGWLLITASCTVCTHWHIFSFVKYVLLHAQSLKEAKNGVQNLFISLQMEFGATSWKITRICISPKKLDFLREFVLILWVGEFVRSELYENVW